MECFAKSTVEDFSEHQKQVLKQLVDHCAAQFQESLWVMDSVHFHVPNGAHNDPFSFKACVLGIWQDTVVWPMLWAFVPESCNETVVGKEVMAAAEEALGEGFICHLLIDRGYLDGSWLTELYQKGTQVTIGVKEDMLRIEN